MKQSVQIIFVLLIIQCSGILFGQGVPGGNTPVNASVERMEEWNEWKFGLFIHWGAYSQAAPANGRIGALLDKDPAKLAKGLSWYKTFNPVDYDPRQWAKMAKAAGMRYAVLTAKHHDGFCNWDSKVTPFTVSNPECPWSKSENPDNVRAFLDAFRAEGIKVGVYFSHLNWALEDGAAVKRHPKEDPDFIKKYPERWKNYVRIAEEQVRELMTNYGKIDIIWYDIHYPKAGLKDAIPMLKMVRKLQPNIIMDNRGTSEFVDFRVQEQYIPDAPPADYWELNIPTTKVGGFWYKGPEAQYRQGEELIPMFADIIHKGGNFLLNIGPKGDGTVPRGEQDALKVLGEWMKDNGEAVYGTKASPWGKAPQWGRITIKGNRLYLFVFDWKGGAKLALDLPAEQIVKASVLKCGMAVKFAAAGDGVEFTVPDMAAPSAEVSVIAVDFKGKLDAKADWPTTKRVKVHHFDKEVKAKKNKKK